jgi:molybdate transport system substrate-binding protein
MLGSVGVRSAPVQTAASVTIFAAASLTDALRAVAERPGRSGPPWRLSFAASSTLARQIEQGAPADIFISADEAWMDYLVRRQRIVEGSRRDVAANRLVVVRPGAPLPGEHEPPETIEALRAALLSGSDRIATGDPAHVPAGRYAQAALAELGLWSAVAPRLVRADNVRSALAFVERDEAGAGIVYATDARLSRSVRVVARFPAASHPPIRYPAALVVGAAPGARAAWDELFTAPAQALFRDAGFGKP